VAREVLYRSIAGWEKWRSEVADHARNALRNRTEPFRGEKERSIEKQIRDLCEV
jgi:hypothetical protein